MNPATFLDGYKTLIAGIGLIALGVYEATQGNVDQGLTHMAGGLGLIGVGRKLDKAATVPGTP